MNRKINENKTIFPKLYRYIALLLISKKYIVIEKIITKNDI